MARCLNTCQPDIASIATPGGAHYEPIAQAIEFGCHVFCEKPMTHSGEVVAPYPTFKQGCQYQQLIDIIRKNDNWTDVRDLS